MTQLFNSVPFLTLCITGIYFAILLPISIVLFHLRHPGPQRPSGTWWLLFCVWPLGPYIYAIFNIPKKSHALGSFLGIFWILYAITVGTAAATHARKDLRSTINHLEDIIVKSQGLNKDQKADLNGSLMILSNEVKRTPLFELEKVKRQQQLVDRLSIYLQDNKITSQELKSWNDSYRQRAPASK